MQNARQTKINQKYMLLILTTKEGKVQSDFVRTTFITITLEEQKQIFSARYQKLIVVLSNIIRRWHRLH